MRRLPGGEAEVAEDDVLDAGLEERLSAREHLARLLVEEEEDDREVVHAEAPERVLVLPDRPQVLAVPVDVEHLAELARVDQLLQLEDARVVEEQVAGQEGEPALLRERHQRLGVVGAERHRLLDEDVLARGQRPARELCVRRHRGRDDDRLDGVVGEQLVEARRGARGRVAGRGGLQALRARVADPGEPGQLVEVPGEVGAPRPQAGDRDRGSAVGAHRLIVQSRSAILAEAFPSP